MESIPKIGGVLLDYRILGPRTDGLETSACPVDFGEADMIEAVGVSRSGQPIEAEPRRADDPDQRNEPTT
jgi:hypothetical protein